MWGRTGRRFAIAASSRIRTLAIPPAWRRVWICPQPNGHIQATGTDAKGRKQYRYHSRWREVRDATKYDRMIAFAEVLPAVRDRVEADLALSGLPRETVLAAVVRLLDETAIRVGNQQYARENESYGLTTLRTKHLEMAGSTLRFQFRGKSGKERAVEVQDRRVAKVVRSCQELPGQELFQYLDDGGVRRVIESKDVNDYLRQISGQEFSAKDFRTWAGTRFAARALWELGPAQSGTVARKNVTAAVRKAAARLGNTPTICLDTPRMNAGDARFCAAVYATAPRRGLRHGSPPRSTPRLREGAARAVRCSWRRSRRGAGSCRSPGT
jgi:DNA topoisomerase I